MAYQRQHYSDDAETDKFEDCSEEEPKEKYFDEDMEDDIDE